MPFFSDSAPPPLLHDKIWHVYRRVYVCMFIDIYYLGSTHS